MGWFSSKKQPELKIPTAEEIFQQAMGFAQSQFPGTTGAREKAATYLSTEPYEREFQVEGPDYAAFGPTSFEEALSAQHFQNVWPDVQRQIKHGLSLSGMASSPILGAQLGRERGRLGVDIGQYLTGLGQQRAEADLARRMQLAQMGEQARQFNVGSALSLDPMNIIAPFAETQSQQSALQAQEQLRRYQQEQAGGGGAGIGALLGMGAGAIAAPFTGGLSLLPAMAMGGSLGGTVGSLFGGGQAPIDIGTAMQIGQMPGQMKTQDLLNQYIGQQIQPAMPQATKVGG